MGSPTVMTTGDSPSWLLAENLCLRGRRKETLRELIDFLTARQGGTQELAECLLGKKDSLLEPQISMSALVAEIAGEVPKQSRDDYLALLGRAVPECKLVAACGERRHPCRSGPQTWCPHRHGDMVGKECE